MSLENYGVFNKRSEQKTLRSIQDIEEIEEIKNKYYIRYDSSGQITLTNKTLHNIAIIINHSSSFDLDIGKDIYLNINNCNIGRIDSCNDNYVLVTIESLMETINESINKYKEFISYCIEKSFDDHFMGDYHQNLNNGSLVIRNKDKFVHIRLSFTGDYNGNDFIPVIIITNSSLDNNDIYYLDSMNYSDVWNTIEFYL